jgi:hypothetical protein
VLDTLSFQRLTICLARDDTCSIGTHQSEQL